MDVDIAIIGAGINGCGIASDAAGRKLSVALIDKGDLGSATSNASTKLIHGGLRYLEQYQWALVKESLNEQQWLSEYGSYLVEPLKFIIAHHPMRSALTVRAGLFLYDTLCSRTLPTAKMLTAEQHQQLSLFPLPDKAFSYYDYQTDDHRLCVCEALDAKARGAQIYLQHTIVSISAEEKTKRWKISLKDKKNSQITLSAKALVNASGPWVKEVKKRYGLPCDESFNLKLSQGSHLIVQQLYEEQQAYLLQEDDGRIVFTVPYHGHTLIGTTDYLLEKMPNHPSISASETAYLLGTVEKYFSKRLKPSHIVATQSGVRALLNTSDKTSDCSREYKIIQGTSPKGPLCWHIIGGKITTWRSLAEKAVNQISTYFPKSGPAWTKQKLLPGARFLMNRAQIEENLTHNFPQMPGYLLSRLARTYGLRSYLLLGHRRIMKHMGKHFGKGLTEREIEFLKKHEWVTCYDSLMRRTRLQFSLSTQEQDLLKEHLERVLETT